MMFSRKDNFSVCSKYNVWHVLIVFSLIRPAQFSGFAGYCNSFFW
jgi:hypothetical protein